MDNLKHTPGPWQLHYDVADFSVTAKDGEERVCYVGSEANAKLIAAAPDMLEFIEQYILQRKNNNVDPASPDYAKALAIFDKATK